MRREQSLMVLLSRTELKTGLAQTLWSEVCFFNTTNSPSKAECGFGWFVSPKSILKRGRLACCLLWKQRTDSPISIKYCLSFASGLNHVSGPSDNGSGRHTFRCWFRNCVFPAPSRSEAEKKQKDTIYSPKTTQVIIQPHEWKQTKGKWRII